MVLQKIAEWKPHTHLVTRNEVFCVSRKGDSQGRNTQEGRTGLSPSSEGGKLRFCQNTGQAAAPEVGETNRWIQRITIYQSGNPWGETSAGSSTRFLLPSTSCLALNKKFTNYTKRQKHSLKRKSKHQNQIQIWQGCWNYQTGDLK